MALYEWLCLPGKCNAYIWLEGIFAENLTHVFINFIHRLGSYSQCFTVIEQSIIGVREKALG